MPVLKIGMIGDFMKSWVKEFFEFYKDVFSIFHDCECINDFITYFFLLFFAILFLPFAYIVCILHDLGEFPFRRCYDEEEGS